MVAARPLGSGRGRARGVAPDLTLFGQQWEPNGGGLLFPIRERRIANPYNPKRKTTTDVRLVTDESATSRTHKLMAECEIPAGFASC